MNGNPNIGAGARYIEPFKWESPRHLLDPDEANKLVTLLNALLRARIVRGSKDQVHISDRDIVFELQPEGTTEQTITETSSGYYPFKLYQFPGERETTSDANDWRKFRIRNGFVIGEDFLPYNTGFGDGTDGIEFVDADETNEDDMDDILADDTDVTWVWIEVEWNIGASEWRWMTFHSTTQPAFSALVIPVGYISPNSGAETITFRQITRADLQIPCL